MLQTWRTKFERPRHRAKGPSRFDLRGHAESARARRSQHLQHARADDDEAKEPEHDGPDGEVLLLHPRSLHRPPTVDVPVELL